MNKYYENGRLETVTGNFATAWISTDASDTETEKMIRNIKNSSLSEGTRVVLWRLKR